jgi:heme-degrading monooxygenase HmoA
MTLAEGDGVYARVTRIRGQQARIEAASVWFQEELLADLERIDGYCDAMLLVDHEHGETLAISFWETPEAMRASEHDAERLRAEAATVNEGAVTSVERFEVVVEASSLRSPH